MVVWTLRPGQVGIVAAGLAITAACWIFFRPWDIGSFVLDVPFGRDYVNFWISPRLMLAGQGDLFTDIPAYRQAIVEAFHLARDPGLFFVYPPHALLFLTPLALLPFIPAVLVWTALNLAALAAALRLVDVAPAVPRRTLTLVVLSSPAAAAMVMYGHFGGLIALASTLAIVESERRYWLAGLCLACLSVKPQFACILGLILLGAGRWRCLMAAGAGTLALAGLSILAFGIEPWQRFVGFTVPMQNGFIADFNAHVISTSISLYFSLRFWGASADLAWTVQGVVSALAIAAAILALRSRREDPRTLFVILLGSIVALPYASHYELAIVAPTLTLLVLDRSVERTLSPLALLTWLSVPLALILFRLHLPVLSLFAAGALFSQAWRLYMERRSQGIAAPSHGLARAA